MHDATQPPDRTLLDSLPAWDASRWRIVSRWLASDRRRAGQTALQTGTFREFERVDLLAPEGLEQLAARSLWLLLGSGAAFLALDATAHAAHGSGPLLGTGSPWVRGALLIAANVASYAAVLPLHEAMHALVMLALGGRPRFGLKLPFAAYCTAPDQLFTRNGYIAVALAPLVILSAAGVATTWVAPDVGACILLGLAGNAAGAVADLATVARAWRLPPETLILDTETGYTAIVLASDADM